MLGDSPNNCDGNLNAFEDHSPLPPRNCDTWKRPKGVGHGDDLTMASVKCKGKLCHKTNLDIGNSPHGYRGQDDVYGALQSLWKLDITLPILLR